MKITEIINEAALGTQAQFRRITMPRIDPVDTSAPWVQKAINNRKEITKNLSNAKSDKEQLDYLWKSGISPHSFRVIDSKTGYTLKISRYFRETGKIILTRESRLKSGPMLITYAGNVNDGIEYKGKHRTMASGATVYTFKVHGLQQQGKPEKIVPAEISAKSTAVIDPWGRTK